MQITDLTVQEDGTILSGLRAVNYPLRTDPPPEILLYLRALQRAFTRTAPAAPPDPAKPVHPLLLQWTTTHCDGLIELRDDFGITALHRPPTAGDRREAARRLGYEQSQWISELLTTREIGSLLGLDPFAIPHPCGPLPPAGAVWRALSAPRSLAEVIRHHLHLAIFGLPSSLEMLNHILPSVAVNTFLAPPPAPPLPVALAWPGLLTLPIVLEPTRLVQTTGKKDSDDSLFTLLHHHVDPTAAPTTAAYLRWRLIGGGVLLIVPAMDTLAAPIQYERLFSSLSAFLHRYPDNRLIITSTQAVIPGKLPPWLATTTLLEQETEPPAVGATPD
ncbi:MAG: hypothetical protein NVSMB42_21710 [Herpetosiphon sp.]